MGVERLKSLTFPVIPKVKYFLAQDTDVFTMRGPQTDHVRPG